MADNNIKAGVYNRNGEDFKFNFKTSLTATEKVSFVNSITETLVGDNYNYVLKDIIFDFCIIDTFCVDFDTSDIFKSKSKIESIENLLDETNIVDIIKANVDDGIISELSNAVDLNIEYRTGIHSNPIEPIAKSLSKVLDKLERKLDDIDFGTLMGLADDLSSVSGELTMSKMLEAYANSDMYKNNWNNNE